MIGKLDAVDLLTGERDDKADVDPETVVLSSNSDAGALKGTENDTGSPCVAFEPVLTIFDPFAKEESGDTTDDGCNTTRCDDAILMAKPDKDDRADV